MPSGSRLAQEARTMSLSWLPRRVSQGLRVLGPCFHHRHPRGFRWRLGLPRVYGDRANGKELSRHGPAQMASQHYRRLLGATSWGPQTWLWWFAQEAVKAFPAPEDGVLSLVGDRT